MVEGKEAAEGEAALALLAVGTKDPLKLESADDETMGRAGCPACSRELESEAESNGEELIPWESVERAGAPSAVHDEERVPLPCEIEESDAEGGRMGWVPKADGVLLAPLVVAGVTCGKAEGSLPWAEEGCTPNMEGAPRWGGKEEAGPQLSVSEGWLDEVEGGAFHEVPLPAVENAGNPLPASAAGAAPENTADEGNAPNAEELVAGVRSALIANEDDRSVVEESAGRSRPEDRAGNTARDFAPSPAVAPAIAPPAAPASGDCPFPS